MPNQFQSGRYCTICQQVWEFDSVLGREIKYLDRSNNEDHYSLTPYRDISRKAKKITPKEWIDIGEGILEVIEGIRSGK